MVLLFLAHQERNSKPNSRQGGSEALSNKVRDLEAKLRGGPALDKKPKDLIRAVGSFSSSKLFCSAPISCCLSIFGSASRSTLAFGVPAKTCPRSKRKPGGRSASEPVRLFSRENRQDGLADAGAGKEDRGEPAGGRLPQCWPRHQSAQMEPRRLHRQGESHDTNPLRDRTRFSDRTRQKSCLLLKPKTGPKNPS